MYGLFRVFPFENFWKIYRLTKSWYSQKLNSFVDILLEILNFHGTFSENHLKEITLEHVWTWKMDNENGPEAHVEKYLKLLNTVC